MGDVHFDIRNGMTGFVFLVFVLVGLFFMTSTADFLEILTLFQLDGTGSVSGLAILATLAGAFLTTPVFGVVIQGVHVAFMYAFGRAFTDPARMLIARDIRRRVGDLPVISLGAETILGTDPAGQAGTLSKKLRKRYSGGLGSVSDDSLFVWLYYTQAPEHMIDWARRRRSYNYLGRNWVIAAVAGVLLGMLVPWVGNQEEIWIRSILAGVLLVWAAGALWTARQMRLDVDGMEFAWALSRLYPEKFKPFLPDKGSARDDHGLASEEPLPGPS